MKSVFKAALFVIAVVGGCLAESISGAVVNGSANQPVAGDQVLLLRFSQGLQEVGRTTTDAKGHFSFNFKPSGPHVVRVIHQGQVYDREPHPGAKAVNIQVFDTSQNSKQLSTPVVIVGLRAAKDALEVIELHVVDNTSSPPQTVDSEAGFPTLLPDGAELEWVRGMAPGERPVSISAARLQRDNSYGLHFPMRPGETRLQVAYRVNSSDKTDVVLQFPTTVPRLAIVVPDGLHFTPAKGLQLQRAAEKGAEVEMIAGVTAGQRIAFHVTGSAGAMSETSDTKGAQARTAALLPAVRSEIRTGRNAGSQRTVQAPTQASQDRAYILAGILLAIAFAILLLRIVAPQLYPRWRALGTHY